MIEYVKLIMEINALILFYSKTVIQTSVKNAFTLKKMSITYRSSFSFSKPSHYTISRAQIEDALYQHKKRLSINQRSTSLDKNYKTQRLSIKQVKTIENLSKKTKTYSLNTLLKNYNNNFNTENFYFDNQNEKNNPEIFKKDKKLFSTIQSEFYQSKSSICQEKMKLFKQGVNYRSQQRSKGTGVKNLNLKDLETYFQRTIQQQCSIFDSPHIFKKYNTIQFNQKSRNNESEFKFNRVKSSRLVN